MVETTITVDTENVKKRSADGRGRVRLGPDLAGKTVEVAVLDADESPEDGSQEE